MSKHSRDVEMRLERCLGNVFIGQAQTPGQGLGWNAAEQIQRDTLFVQLRPGLKIDYIWVRERTQDADRVPKGSVTKLSQLWSFWSFCQDWIQDFQNPLMTSWKSQLPCAGFSDWTFLWWSISTLLGRQFLLLWEHSETLMRCHVLPPQGAIIDSHKDCEATGEWPSDHGCISSAYRPYSAFGKRWKPSPPSSSSSTTTPPTYINSINNSRNIALTGLSLVHPFLPLWSEFLQ